MEKKMKAQAAKPWDPRWYLGSARKCMRERGGLESGGRRFDCTEWRRNVWRTVPPTLPLIVRVRLLFHSHFLSIDSKDR